MGRTISFPDGSVFASTALTRAQVETAWQLVVASMLGITVSPLTIQFTFTSGQNVASVLSTLFLYAGQLVVAPGLPANSLIIAVGPGNTVSFTTLAIQTGTQNGTVTDPNLFSKVRVGWQLQGQPGPAIGSDTAFVMCEPIDSEYSRLHDLVYLASSGITTSTQDVFTRRWKLMLTFYGPYSLDNARLCRSGIVGIPYVEGQLEASSIYVDPDLEEPKSIPELFQGQWWERADLVAEFNEQITETLTVGTVASVEVEVYTVNGKQLDITVT